MYDPLITVCDKCHEASCWQGKFMCDDDYGAGTVDLQVSQLLKYRTKEHPDYYNMHLDAGHERLLTAEDLKALGVTDEDMLNLSPVEDIR